MSNRNVACFILLALSGAIGWSAAATQSYASDHPKRVKAIIFGEQTVDPSHSMRWHGWTISFGIGRPFGEFGKRGIAVRGLRCEDPKTAPFKCHLLMSMRSFESFAHFCEILPDTRHAPRPWPLRIDCPNEIKFEPPTSERKKASGVPLQTHDGRPT